MTLSPKLAFFNIAATLAYLGLAVLGGADLPLSSPIRP